MQEQSSTCALSIIIPVRDEEECVSSFHETLLRTIDTMQYDVEILYVENGSRDNTLSVLQQLPRATVLSLRTQIQGKPRKADALQAGFDYSTGDIIVTIDGDGQNDPEDIPRLLYNIDQGNDVVVGWRQKRRDPVSIRIVSGIGNGVRRLFSIGSAIHDPACGLRAFRRECIIDERLYGERDRFLPDILACAGWNVCEIPVAHFARAAGTSKYPSSKALRASADLLGLWYWQRFGDRPLQFFGSLGLLLCALGTALWGVLGALRMAEVIYLSERIWPLLATTSLLLGVQLLLFGLLADTFARQYYRTRPSYNVRPVKTPKDSALASNMEQPKRDAVLH